MTPTIARFGSTKLTTTTSRGKNRRQNCRYAVAATLQYRLIDCGSIWKEGRTVDMSARGIRMDLEGLAPEGSSIEIVLAWPGIFHGRDRVYLWVRGEVVRSERFGTAVHILRHEFRPVEPVIARRTPQSRHGEGV